LALDPITAILNIGNTIIDRILPDKTAAAAAKVQLVQAELAGELQSAHDQLVVDQVEAASNSVFVAGWRPFIGWICGSALAWSYIFQPAIVAIAAVAKHPVDPNALPHLNMTELLGLLATMMGNSVLRTIDKIQGTGNGQ
jgi:hypothetical protein